MSSTFHRGLGIAAACTDRRLESSSCLSNMIELQRNAVCR